MTDILLSKHILYPKEKDPDSKISKERKIRYMFCLIPTHHLS